MTRIIHRHDTSANWTSVNPTLSQGEFGVEDDTGKFKIGDGQTAWNILAYASSGGGESSGGGTSLLNAEGTKYDELTLGTGLEVVEGKLNATGGAGGAGTQITSADGATEYGELKLGDTLAVADGVLNANLDEIGNEVNTLAGRVTSVESVVENKQDKFYTEVPISIETKTLQPMVGITNNSGTFTTENNDSYVKPNVDLSRGYYYTANSSGLYNSHIIQPYKFGQVVKYPTDEYSSTCVLFGQPVEGTNKFKVSIIAFPTGISYDDVTYNSGGVSIVGCKELPTAAHTTKLFQCQALERASKQSANSNAGYSYAQVMLTDNGEIILGKYGRQGTYTYGLYSTDVFRAGQSNMTTEIIEDAKKNITHVMWLVGGINSNSRELFGLYDTNARMPWNDADFATWESGLGADKLNISDEILTNHLKLNVGDGLQVINDNLVPSKENFNRYGDITVSNDGIMSNFSNSNFGRMTIPTIPSNTSKIEYIVKFKATTQRTYNMIWGINPTGKAVQINLSNSKFTIWSGASGGLSLDTPTTVLNTWYWGRVINENGNNYLYLITDEGFTLDTLPDVSDGRYTSTSAAANFEGVNNSIHFNGAQAQFGIEMSNADQYWYGDLDISEFAIKADDKVVYTPFNKTNKELTLDVTNLNNTKTTKYEAAQASMPSSKYIDLTLGASGDSYTAPASGWYYFDKSATTASQFVVMKNQTSGHLSNQAEPIGTSTHTRCNIECKKGDVISIEYSLAGTTNTFRFIYAQGEV